MYERIICFYKGKLCNIIALILCFSVFEPSRATAQISIHLDQQDLADDILRLAPIPNEDLRICGRTRSSISPSGRFAVFDKPLARNRFSPWIGEPHVEASLLSNPNQPQVLVDLDCVLQAHTNSANQDDCALATQSMPSSPWSDVAWADDSSYFSIVLSNGRIVAEGSQRVFVANTSLLTENSSPSNAVITEAFETNIVLPFRVDADVGIGDFSPSQQAFSILDSAYQDISSLTISENAVGIEYQAGTQNIPISIGRYNSLVRSASDSSIVVSTDRTDIPTTTTIDLESGSISELVYWPTERVSRPIYASGGEYVVGFYAEREVLATADVGDPARRIIEAINAHLRENLDLVVLDIDFSEAENRAIVIFQGHRSHRQVILFEQSGNSTHIGQTCQQDDENGGYFEREYLAFETENGRIPVVRFQYADEDLSTEPTDVEDIAIIWFPADLTENAEFGLPAISPLAMRNNIQIFAVANPGAAGRGWAAEEIPATDSIWNMATSLCQNAVDFVRQSYDEEFEQVGVFGWRYGGVIALTAMNQNGCDADFAIVQNPVISASRSEFYPEGYEAPTNLGNDQNHLFALGLEHYLNSFEFDNTQRGLIQFDIDHAWIDSRPIVSLIEHGLSEESSIQINVRRRPMASRQPVPQSISSINSQTTPPEFLASIQSTNVE